MGEPDYSINKSEECNSSDSEEKSSRDPVIIQPRRKLIIEPLLMMGYLFSAPLMQVYQLFVYDRMEEIVAKRPEFINTSILHHPKNVSTNPCLEELNKSSIEYDFTQAAQTINAQFSMVSKVLSTVPSLFVMVIVGAYSDKGGRRIAILPYVIAEFFSSVNIFLVLYFKLSIWYLQVSSIVTGLAGGFELMLVGCYAYMADTTTKEERLFRFTLLTILEEMVSIIGPIGIGYWIQKQGYLWPVVFSMIGRFIYMAYAIFCIPETIQKDRNAKLFTLSHIKRSALVFMKKDDQNKRWNLWMLLLAFILTCIGLEVYSSLSLFELNTPLCWGAVIIGYYKTTSAAVATIGGICFTRGLKLFLADETIGLIAAAFYSAQYIYMVFIKNTLMVFLGKH